MTELEIMFAKIVAIGETAWTPTIGPILHEQQDVGFEDVVDLDEGSGDSNGVNIMATQTEGNNEKKEEKHNKLFN
ncbi:hypothetical protein SLA2020_058850 [Shorea laevis]